MGKEFLNDLNIHGAGQIQFKTTAGANAGKIDQDGNNLVLTNAVGDILLGDGSSDVFIGDGTNNVDIIFEYRNQKLLVKNILNNNIWTPNELNFKHKYLYFRQIHLAHDVQCVW